MNFKKLFEPDTIYYKVLFAITAITITAVIGILLVRAGSLNPTAPPADTDHTLDDIYHKLDKTAGDSITYGIDSSANPSSTGTMHNLTQIYNATPVYLAPASAAGPGDVCITGPAGSFSGKTKFYANPVDVGGVLTATRQTGTGTDCYLSYP